MLISKVIYEGERSFNRTSTPSRLSFVRPPPIPYHHLHPSPPISPSTTRCNPAMSLPSLEGCGLTFRRLNLPGNAACAPPLFTGMWRLKFARRRNWGGRNTRGDPGYGRPIRCVTKANHDERRGSFSSFLHAFHPTDQPST